MHLTRIENTRPTVPVIKRFDHIRVRYDHLNIVAETGLPLGCAHIGGKSTYAISCVSPTAGLHNTFSLRRLCVILARPSRQRSYCGVVRPLLFSSTKHGDCLQERAARVRAR
jgi:hypothetical protein